ncbi:MAG: hypothetical protein ACJAXY_001930 [Nonlabens sp.]|jgi:hypothetical protein|uniref:hypothetical protein n=1 Tax=Nonlabens sp. TaxID=1888209 RepID=UPI0039E27867
MSESNIYYTDKENLVLSFAYLIFNVESINKKYGSLSSFVRDFNLFGETNGKLYILSEMVMPHMHLAELVQERMRWTRLREKEDYVFGCEHIIYGVNHSVSNLLNCEIPELKNIDWLGSIITHKGNYVWFNKNPNENQDHILTFRENRLEGAVPKKYYQQLLLKHLEYYNPDKLKFNPKVFKVDNYYVFFDMDKYYGKNAIARQTLERFREDSIFGNG